MTIETTNNYVTSIGDGVQVSFPYNFLIFDETHMYVEVDDVEVTSGFTVTGVGNPAGGTVDFSVAPGNGLLVLLKRVVPMVQASDFTGYGRFPAASIEQAYDLVTMANQQNANELSRTPVTHEDVTLADNRLPRPVSGKSIIWNDTADGFAEGPDALDIANAGPNAAAAAASAAAALVSENNAATSEANIAAAAAQITQNANDIIELQNNVKFIQASQVSSGFLPPTATGRYAMAAMTDTRIAWVDTGNDELRCYDYNGTTWTLVGSGLPLGVVVNPSLCALSSTRVAYIDSNNDSLRVYDFNGSTWSLVGSGLTIGGTGAPSLSALSSSRVAFVDGGLDVIRTYDFNGSTWSLVGNSLDISTISNPYATALNGSRIALIDSTTGNLRAYDFDNTNWAQVGNSLNLGSIGLPGIAALTGNSVALTDGINHNLSAFRFDGTNWVQSGYDFAISPSSNAPILASLNGTDVMYIDTTNNDLRVLRFSFYIGNGPFIV